MREFTVLLLYPDYLANNYGQDTYMTCVNARSVAQAIKKAQKNAATDNETKPGRPEDFYVLCVIAGNHQNIKDQH